MPAAEVPSWVGLPRTVTVAPVSDRVNWPPAIAAVSSVSPMAGWKVTSM